MRNSGDNCNNSQCLMRSHDDVDAKINSTLFCCCKGDLCNSKLIVRPYDIVVDFAEILGKFD